MNEITVETQTTRIIRVKYNVPDAYCIHMYDVLVKHLEKIEGVVSARAIVPITVNPPIIEVRTIFEGEAVEKQIDAMIAAIDAALAEFEGDTEGEEEKGLALATKIIANAIEPITGKLQLGDNISLLNEELAGFPSDQTREAISEDEEEE